MSDLPPCGIYRTREPIGQIPQERLVYFHNHGEPGPGIYLPSSWTNNRADWQPNGTLLGAPENAAKLAPLKPEGFYRVREPFHCCEKECRRFEAELLVQLGYNAAAQPIVFVPSLEANGLGLSETGSRIDPDRVSKLALLKVPRATKSGPPSHVH